jgi:hypothetical protein
MATTGKIAQVMFESAKDTYESQNQLLPLCTFNEPDPEKQQNSNNVVWYPVQQHAPVINGWDLTGEETDIIEETYPVILGVPTNDFVSQRADDLRDKRFWERRGEQSGRRQASNLNQKIANAIKTQGSLFYRSSATSGYDFIAEGQALLNERQTYTTERSYVLNDRDTLKFSSELAGRETIKGRPAETWLSGQIGSNVAEFNIYTGSYLPNIVGGAAISTTVTGDQSFKPEGGSSDSDTGIVTNVDYRSATMAVAASASYNIGDKVTIDNAATPVQALGLDDKTDTGQAMTFTVVAKPTATSITVYPKPIAADDPALSTLEKAYANIDTQILNAATVERVNTDATKKSNLFWDKSAVEVTGGTIPAELFAQYDGMKVITDTMSNGLQLYMIYDGDIATMTFRYRLFTWWGITVCNPSAAGISVTFSA